MGRIRAFCSRDIPQVARLHQAVFRPSGLEHTTVATAYRSYFENVFLESPFSDPDLPSLVYEDDDETVLGFLGVMPRRMMMNGKHFQAAVSSQFVVDPQCTVALVAVRLAKTFLDGPQDISIADEANDASRRIWEGLGGSTSRLLSLHWTRPLRPAGLAVSLLQQRPGYGAIATLARPVATAIDAVVTRLPGSYFQQPRPDTATAELQPTATMRWWPTFLDARMLHVEYDEQRYAWLLARAAERRTGKVFRVLLKQGQQVLGWYISHLTRARTMDVLQLAATPSSIDRVLDHLFYGAWREGATAVSGRLEPRFVQALSDKYCLFHRRGPWMLMHARNPTLLQAFRAGDVSFSRVDGEWSLAF